MSLIKLDFTILFSSFKGRFSICLELPQRRSVSVGVSHCLTNSVWIDLHVIYVSHSQREPGRAGPGQAGLGRVSLVQDEKC